MLLYDIVIPLGKNDFDIIDQSITYNKKNILNYRNIYIITNKEFKKKIDNVIFIDEDIFPFKLNEMKLQNRNNWYFQQLLKLYSGFIIPNILDNYLVIDSDTFVLKPLNFISTNNKYLFGYSNEYHKPYFDHMKLLLDDLGKKSEKSGICHYMIFNNKIVEELFDKVYKKHNKDFWKVFIDSLIQIKPQSNSMASEYEIYFNYMLKYHSEKIEIRKLKTKNSNILILNENLDMISLHFYLR